MYGQEEWPNRGESRVVARPSALCRHSSTTFNFAGPIDAELLGIRSGETTILGLGESAGECPRTGIRSWAGRHVSLGSRYLPDDSNQI